jgi:hypothetical protein
LNELRQCAPLTLHVTIAEILSQSLTDVFRVFLDYRTFLEVTNYKKK